MRRLLAPPLNQPVAITASDLIGPEPSDLPAFITAYTATAGTFLASNQNHAYYTATGNPSGYREETFAESFAGYFRSKVSGGIANPAWNTNWQGGSSSIISGRPSLDAFWQSWAWAPPAPPAPKAK